MASEPAPAPAPAQEEKKETVGSFLRFLALLFLITVLVRSLLFAPFYIPSGSMQPNLLIGDYLFVSKWPYGYSRYSFPFGVINFDGRIMESLPERGDIVVFRHPVGDTDLVKRVIGLPGDTIELRNGHLILNGQPIQRERIADFVLPVSPNLLREPGGPCRLLEGGEAREVQEADGSRACAYPQYRETLPGGRNYTSLDKAVGAPADTFGPITVQPGHVFVMGDNRDDSLDSRFPISEGGVGQVPLDRVQGRALIGFWSTDGSAEWLLPWTWFTALRWERLGQGWE